VNRCRLTALAAVAALSFGGCGSSEDSQPPGNRIVGRWLTIYVSVPRNGASAAAGQAVIDGAVLAFDEVHARIGGYRLALELLDDSTGGGQWTASAATLAAQTAAANPTTIGYIGDFDSGASAISIPILNKVAIPQVSPTSSAVGLTSNGLGSSPGEPYAYYPTQLRTFVRVVPSDYVQAVVQLKLQESVGCRSTYVLDDDEYDGEASSEAFVQVAQRWHYDVVATQSYIPGEVSYRSVGQTVAQSGADCILVAAIPARNAVQLTEQVAQEVPQARVFATASLAQPSFTDPAQGGIPATLDGRVLITAAGGDPLTGSRLLSAFTSAYEKRYGQPLPVSVDGYEAMRLLLSAIRRATDDGQQTAQRVKVVQALLDTRRHASPLGTYAIEPDGNTTLGSYGVYRIVDGQLRYWRSITAR